MGAAVLCVRFRALAEPQLAPMLEELGKRTSQEEYRRLLSNIEASFCAERAAVVLPFVRQHISAIQKTDGLHDVARCVPHAHHHMIAESPRRPQAVQLSRAGLHWLFHAPSYAPQFQCSTLSGRTVADRIHVPAQRMEAGRRRCGMFTSGCGCRGDLVVYAPGCMHL